MKKAVAGGYVGLIRGPMGAVIGASIGCSAWQIRVLAEAQGAGIVPWLVLTILFLISTAAAPVIGYYGLVVRRWSGLKTVTVFAASIIATNLLFAAASYLLLGELSRYMKYPQKFVVIVAIIMLVLLLFSPTRMQIAKNLEDWRDTQRSNSEPSE